MQYIERTRAVLEQVRQQPDLLTKIRHICHEHFDGDPWTLEDERAGEGSTRVAYSVGPCNIPKHGVVSIFCKLPKIRGYSGLMTDFVNVAGRDEDTKDFITGVREEFGAFEIYYSYAAGLLKKLRFRNKKDGDGYHLDRWAGTRIYVGDIGGVPFFQLAARYGRHFFCLTEGLPPLIEPKGTARAAGDDYHTVEYDRIIDLSPTQCSIIEMNGGGLSTSRISGEKHPDRFGLIARGKRYFEPKNCLELDP
jgi:hypothetical protein